MRGNMVLPTPLQAFSGMPKAAATTEKQTIVDGEKMTGAEALVRSLEDLGRQGCFRRSRRRDSAGIRCNQ